MYITQNIQEFRGFDKIFIELLNFLTYTSKLQKNQKQKFFHSPSYFFNRLNSNIIMAQLHNTYYNIVPAAKRGTNGYAMFENLVGKDFALIERNLKNKSRPYTENM